MTSRDRLRRVYDVHGEKLRFLVVGVWNTLFSIVLFNILLSLTKGTAQELTGSSVGWVSFLGKNFYVAIFWLAWVVSVVQSTATMKYLVFRSGGSLWKQVGKAYLIYLPAQGISTGILWLAVQVLNLSPRLGQLVAVLITTVFSYLGHKYFTFRAPLEFDDDLGGVERPN